MSEDVLFEVEGPVAIITLNRPARLNAISSGIRKGLAEAWPRFEQDDALKVAILTGSGEKAFCAGMDLKEAAATGIGVPPHNFLPVLGDNVHVSKPVIAAVNGYAYAGGWLLAQQCDLCIASENASFAITEVKVGRGVPWATPLIHMLPQRIMMESAHGRAAERSPGLRTRLRQCRRATGQTAQRRHGDGADHRRQCAADRARCPRAGPSLHRNGQIRGTSSRPTPLRARVQK